MRNGTFIVNGVNSETLNTFIQDRPLIDVPKRKVEFKNAYGVDGSIPFDEEAYENTQLQLTMVTNGPNLIEDRQALVKMLDTGGVYGDLVPYFDPGKIYRFMIEERIQFENKIHYGNTQASQTTLTVKPYKYLIDSPKKTMVKTGSIINPTNYVSQPIIRIEGSGNITLTVGGRDFLMRGISDKITINSEIYSAYTEGATGPLKSMNDKIFTREFPLLTPGNNTVKAVGTVTKIEIEPRWRSIV